MLGKLFCRCGLHRWDRDYIGCVPVQKYIGGIVWWHQTRQCLRCRIEAAPFWWECWVPFLWGRSRKHP